MVKGDGFFQPALSGDGASKLDEARIQLDAVHVARWSYPARELECSESRAATQIDDHLSRLYSRRLEQRSRCVRPREHLLVALEALRLDLGPVVPVVGFVHVTNRKRSRSSGCRRRPGTRTRSLTVVPRTAHERSLPTQSCRDPRHLF